MVLFCDYITPTRGLRQEDPLSPYLFLLCAEGLTSLITHEAEQGYLMGVKVCRGAPTISHMLFIDDSLISMRADEENATSLRRVLDRYCAASRQLVSEAKSSIFFSPCTEAAKREKVCSTLNILTVAITNKYLGLPPIIGVECTDCLMHLIERIIRKINGWKEKIISYGGKEVLIKAIAQALPAYAMIVFRLRKQVCQG
jgi:hypothetical protein